MGRFVGLLASVWLGCVPLVCGCATARREGSREGSISNKEPSEFLRQYAATRRFSAGQPTGIRVLPDSTAVLFLRSGPRSFKQDLYEFDVHTGHERLLLSAEQVLGGAQERLSEVERARRERMRLSARGITSYQISKDGRRLLVPLSGRLFVIDRVLGNSSREQASTSAITELVSNNGYPIDAQFSPDGKKVACVRNGEVYAIDIDNGAETKVTRDAGATISNGLAEFVAQEEMGRFHGFWWSPDSRQIVFQQTDTSAVETLHIMDAVHPDRVPSIRPYPRPGKANAKVRLGIIDAAGGETTWINWDRELFPYLATVRWSEHAPLTILVQNREQTEELLLAVDPATGYTITLLVEKDKAWINLDQRMPHWFKDGSGFLWTTERQGAWQLERRDRDGGIVRSLTPAAFGFQELVSFDDAHHIAYVRASQDPTQTQLYAVDLSPQDEPTIRPITKTPGIHGAVFSKDHRVLVHVFEEANGRRQQVVERIDGSSIGHLRSVAEEPPFMPNVEFTTVGHDPSFYAAVVRPRDFRAGRKYPVIVNVYGGPHAQMVTLSRSRYLLQQWMADRGFIVVMIDGRGTPARGRAWERITKGNLIKVPLEDQVAGLKALGQKYEELNLDRVGIFGWSFGGYFSAHAVLQRPDVYRAGVAGAPVVDWRDYDTHYTERYMGLPANNEVGYAAASALTYADKLERPLLLIHGTADDNVYFANSLKLSNALFRAGKQHNFLVLSDFTHMVADPLVTQRLYERIMTFFQEHLLSN